MILALLYYREAATLWQAKITLRDSFQPVMKTMRSGRTECPQLAEILDRTEATWREYLNKTESGKSLSRAIRPGDSFMFDKLTLEYAIPALWTCAASQIAAAEKAEKSSSTP
jgi:hypothetical protein